MDKRYDFEFYTINPKGDWSLYLIKNTGVLGRRDLLRKLKLDGYVYDRSQRAYFQDVVPFLGAPSSRFAVVITLHK